MKLEPVVVAGAIALAIAAPAKVNNPAPSCAASLDVAWHHLWAYQHDAGTLAIVDDARKR